MFSWTTFGRIKFNDETYNHDIVVGLDGTVRPREADIAEKAYGSGHKLGKEELAAIVEDGAELLIVGSGQMGVLQLTEDGVEFLKERGVDFLVMETPLALKKYNKMCVEKKTVALMHVTC